MDKFVKLRGVGPEGGRKVSSPCAARGGTGKCAGAAPVVAFPDFVDYLIVTCSNPLVSEWNFLNEHPPALISTHRYTAASITTVKKIPGRIIWKWSHMKTWSRKQSFGAFHQLILVVHCSELFFHNAASSVGQNGKNWGELSKPVCIICFREGWG